MNKDETLVKITEAAKMLNVHPNTLRKWDNKGILVSIRFGERQDRRYKVSDIEEYIARNKK